MKLLSYALMMISLLALSGCKSEKIQVIHSNEVVTNTVPAASFNDQRYVWESWTVGTNIVISNPVE